MSHVAQARLLRLALACELIAAALELGSRLPLEWPVAVMWCCYGTFAGWGFAAATDQIIAAARKRDQRECRWP